MASRCMDTAVVSNISQSPHGGTSKYSMGMGNIIAALTIFGSIRIIHVISLKNFDCEKLSSHSYGFRKEVDWSCFNNSRKMRSWNMLRFTVLLGLYNLTDSHYRTHPCHMIMSGSFVQHLSAKQQTHVVSSCLQLCIDNFHLKYERPPTKKPKRFESVSKVTAHSPSHISPTESLPTHSSERTWP